MTDLDQLTETLQYVHLELLILRQTRVQVGHTGEDQVRSLLVDETTWQNGVVRRIS